MLDQQKIDMYIMTNQKYFPEEKIVYLKEKLRTMDDEKFFAYLYDRDERPYDAATCLDFSRGTRY